MQKLILDTNIAIAYLNGMADVMYKINQMDALYLPAVVCGELLYGAKNSSKSALNIEKYLNFINSCVVLEVDLTIANTYSSIRHELKLKGNPIPENDIWIAATGLIHNIPIYTLDKHFNNINNLLLFI